MSIKYKRPLLHCCTALWAYWRAGRKITNSETFRNENAPTQCKKYGVLSLTGSNHRLVRRTPERHLLLLLTAVPGFCYRNLSSPGCWTTTPQSGPPPQNCSRASCCRRRRWRSRSCTRCCTTRWPTWTGRPTAPWWPRSSPSASRLPSTTPTTATYWRWASRESCAWFTGGASQFPVFHGFL